MTSTILMSDLWRRSRPLGRRRRSPGSLPGRFAFSSEEYVHYTGCYHYLYRLYSPVTKRFLTRDPIGEQGGVNLYNFIKNGPVNRWDRHGLDEPILDFYESQYKMLIKDSRSKGYNVAADMIEYFLSAQGGSYELNWTWLRNFSSVISAENRNRERFEKFLINNARALKHNDNKIVYDYWDAQDTASQFTELYYTSGTFTVTSYGRFLISRINNCVTITGFVDHYWWDPYDWHVGLGAYIPGHGVISDTYGVELKKAGRADSFLMESEWNQSFYGQYTIGTLWDSEDFEWGTVNGGSRGVRQEVINNLGDKAMRPSTSVPKKKSR